MTELLSTVCEHCDAKLKLKNPDLEGKKIKCPKCGEAFVVVASGGKSAAKSAKKKKSDDELDFLDVASDDYDEPPEDEELEDYDDQPRRRSKGGKGKSKKKSRRGSGDSGQVVKVLAIVAVALLVLGGGGYGMVQLLKGDGSSDLDWLPTEAKGYVKVQIANIWNANLIQTFKNSKAGQSAAEEMTKSFGKGPQDLKEVITAIAPGMNNGTVLFRATQPFDLAAIKTLNPTATEATHGSGSYLKQGSTAIFLADATTLLVGQEATIQAIITRGKKHPNASKFSFARGYRDHIVWAMVEPDKFSGNSINPIGSSPFMANVKVAVPQTALIRVNAGSDITISGLLAFNTSEESKVTVEKNKAELETAKANFAKQKPAMQSGQNLFMKPEQVTKLINGIEQVMNSVQMSQSGTRMNMNATISQQTVNDFSSFVAESPMGGSLPGLKTLLPSGR